MSHFKADVFRLLLLQCRAPPKSEKIRKAGNANTIVNLLVLPFGQAYPPFSRGHPTPLPTPTRPYPPSAEKFKVQRIKIYTVQYTVDSTGGAVVPPRFCIPRPCNSAIFSNASQLALLSIRKRDGHQLHTRCAQSRVHYKACSFTMSLLHAP